MTAPTPAKADETTDLREAVPYGIIDPDYARVFTIARCLAWAEGYAITMHGSFTRDLDLLAVPWTERACEPEHLVRRIAAATGLNSTSVEPGQKPHGRIAWTLLFPEFGDPRFVDLSVMPREAAHAAEIQAREAAEARAALAENVVGIRKAEAEAHEIAMQAVVALRTAAENERDEAWRQVALKVAMLEHIDASAGDPPDEAIARTICYSFDYEWDGDADADDDVLPDEPGECGRLSKRDLISAAMAVWSVHIKWTAGLAATCVAAAEARADRLAAENAGLKAGRDRVLGLLEPSDFRPCDCQRCTCGNLGDAAHVAAWDEKNALYAAARAALPADLIPKETTDG